MLAAQKTTQTFQVGFLSGHPDPYAWMPRVKSLSPEVQEINVLTRVPTILGCGRRWPGWLSRRLLLELKHLA